MSLLCHSALLVSPIRGLVHSGYSLLSAASPRYYPRIYYLLGRGFPPRCVFLGVLWEGRGRIWSIFPCCPPLLLFALFLTFHTTRRSYEQGAYQGRMLYMFWSEIVKVTIIQGRGGRGGGRGGPREGRRGEELIKGRLVMGPLPQFL